MRIDPQIILTGLVQWNIIDKTEPVRFILIFRIINNKMFDLTLHILFINTIKEEGMIVGLRSKDIAQIVRLQFPDMRGIGA